MRHFLRFSASTGLWLICLNGSAITLPQAISMKKIDITFNNIGGYRGPTTEMTIVNLTNEKLEIKSAPGLIIESEDSTSQRLVISEPINAIIAPKKSFFKIVSTFCINSFRASPYQNEKYTFLKEGDSYLYRLTNFIYTKKTKLDDSQHAVWACMNGYKHLYISDKKSPVLIELQTVVLDIYNQKLSAGLISKDTTPVLPNYIQFQVQGSYDFFVKQEGNYSAYFEDSTGHKLFTFFEDQKCMKGLYPVRFMHAYSDEREKPFYIGIYKGSSPFERVKAVNELHPKQYVRLQHKSSVVFNMREPATANLDLVDSLGNIYVSYFRDKRMLTGIIPFDYSFTIYKPKKTTLYLLLADNSGKVYSRQKINYTQNLMALKGYFYVRLNESADAIFGLYSADDKLIEEFENKRYYKGLQMLPYGFMFDKYAKVEVFLKLKDKNTGKDIQSEKVFVK